MGTFRSSGAIFTIVKDFMINNYLYFYSQVKPDWTIMEDNYLSQQ